MRLSFFMPKPARKNEELLFLPPQPRAAGQAEKRHARVQQHARVAGLGRADAGGRGGGSRSPAGGGDHGGRLGDLSLGLGVRVVLAAALTVPVLGVAVHPAGGGAGGNVLQIVQHFAAEVADVIIVGIRVAGQHFAAAVAFVVIVRVHTGNGTCITGGTIMVIVDVVISHI